MKERRRKSDTYSTLELVVVDVFFYATTSTLSESFYYYSTVSVDLLVPLPHHVATVFSTPKVLSL